MPVMAGAGKYHTFSDNNFECCPNRKSNVVYCILCNATYHPSCLARDVNKDFIKIDEKTVICCEEVSLTYKNLVYKVDKECDISNLKLFVKTVIAEIEKLNKINDDLLVQLSEAKENSRLAESDTSIAQGGD